jgi:hypothetical protein
MHGLMSHKVIVICTLIPIKCLRFLRNKHLIRSPAYETSVIYSGHWRLSGLVYRA